MESRAKFLGRALHLILIVFPFSGFGLAAVTGWLGGELVDRLVVGVDDGAHLNSPNSLSKKSASQNARDMASKV